MDLTPTANFDASGPVFISYRQSDGAAVASALAWRLRAAGIPVWRDRDDLPPGDTTNRLQEALEEGLSAGVIVVTPEMADSWVVREVEAPRLIALNGNEPRFSLGLLNSVETASGSVDYSAPDRLLALDQVLKFVDQQAPTDDGMMRLVKGLLWQRMKNNFEAVKDSGGLFLITVQTRNQPQVYDGTSAQMDIRVRPSSLERLPSVDGLRDLKDTIGLLPDAVTRTKATRIEIRGGAHLSVAFAIGCALPAARIGQLDVLDQSGKRWASPRVAAKSTDSQVQVSLDVNREASELRSTRVAVYVDLVRPESNAAFDRFIETRLNELRAWARISQIFDAPINPDSAEQLASDIAYRIRELSMNYGNAEVDLLLRCPFAMAVLLGRLANTLNIVLYEWDDSEAGRTSDGRPRYCPVLRVRAGRPDGVITDVLVVD